MSEIEQLVRNCKLIPCDKTTIVIEIVLEKSDVVGIRKIGNVQTKTNHYILYL